MLQSKHYEYKYANYGNDTEHKAHTNARNEDCLTTRGGSWVFCKSYKQVLYSKCENEQVSPCPLGAR